MTNKTTITNIVAGALVFPYNHAMAGKNHDASKSNTSIVHSHVKGGDANGGNGGTSSSASSNGRGINENGVR
jgi:hypothetical protein